MGTESEYIGDEFRRNFALLDDIAITPSPFNRIRASPQEWPIAGESIDFLLIPHLVEFEADPHRVLGEAERVLKPEGKLLILGFNPWSLHSMLRYLPQRPPLWNRHFVGSQQLMDWLNLLKFETEFGAGFGIGSAHAVFEPQSVWRKSLASLAAAYAVKAIKRTWTPIPIKPAWLRAPDLLPDQVVAPPLMRKTR
ncbi:MAG: methyltransferase domain-containing protein [Methylococcaceae bacterium]|nr:methyltransferase domain-containing protein [Methylococcaceae bacterium]